MEEGKGGVGMSHGKRESKREKGKVPDSFKVFQLSHELIEQKLSYH